MTTASLRFSTEILRRLGEELNPTLDQSLLELVKNAYDADARRCVVRVLNADGPGGMISVSDDGDGMDAEAIQSAWLILGRSGRSPNQRTRLGRTPAGSKGLGRLAALRLGSATKLVARPRGAANREFHLRIEWAAFEKAGLVDEVRLQIEEVPSEPGAEQGTQLLIENLREAVRRVHRPAVAVLDVGHGNSAVILDAEGVLVVDAGPGATLLEFLESEQIAEVRAILISHSDEDHIKGLISILESGTVKAQVVHLNSDAMKGSKVWDDLITVLDRANRENRLDFHVELTTSNSGDFDCGQIHVEIVAPSPGLAAKGPGSTDGKGRRITSNSASVVIRLHHGGKPAVLLPGDVDDTGLDNLTDSNVPIDAPIAVFPHHGGTSPGTDVVAYTAKFCALVRPEIVIFSIGRGKYATPRPEIVAEVRRVQSQARIMCTQLSNHCASEGPGFDPEHLAHSIAKGKESRKCCAGTIVIQLSESGPLLHPNAQAHGQFIKIAAPSALCAGQPNRA